MKRLMGLYINREDGAWCPRIALVIISNAVFITITCTSSSLAVVKYIPMWVIGLSTAPCDPKAVSVFQMTDLL